MPTMKHISLMIRVGYVFQPYSLLQCMAGCAVDGSLGFDTSFRVSGSIFPSWTLSSCRPIPCGTFRHQQHQRSTNVVVRSPLSRSPVGTFVDTGAGCPAELSGSKSFCRHGAGCLQWSRAPGAPVDARTPVGTFVDTGAGCPAVVSGSKSFCRHGAGCLQWSRAPGAPVDARAGCPRRNTSGADPRTARSRERAPTPKPVS